jgi:hypothetical protein
MRTCAIHQPNFFPWLGYFDKIKRAATFVFLDQVSYPKSGNSMGSWCNRVKIRINGKPDWIACPVIRESGVQSINSVRIDSKRPWRDRIRKLIELNYRNAPNFSSAFNLIDRFLGFETEFLAEFNVNAITGLARYLGYRADLVQQSDLPLTQETATARLVAITKAVRANTYLCGGGSGGYLDESAFKEAGIGLVYQNFEAIPYGGPDTFVPGLSIIDWLMHGQEVGIAGAEWRPLKEACGNSF